MVYPYFLWSIIQGSILVALASVTNSHWSLSDLTAIAWHPMAQFWFLYALFICQLLAAIVVRKTELLIGLAVVSAALINFVIEPVILKHFVFSFPFFVLGMLGHRISPRWKPGYDLPASIASAVLFIVAVGVSGSLDSFNPETLIALPASVCGITMVITVSRLMSGKALRAAVALGQASMTIYVAHLLVAAGLRIVLVRADIISEPWLLLVVCTASGIIIPYLGHMALLRRGLLPLFGLGPLPRKTASAWNYA